MDIVITIAVFLAVVALLMWGAAQLGSRAGQRDAELMEPVNRVVGRDPYTRDLGDDPLDPHGDGTIRPGDPMWNVFQSGRPTIANRRADGAWDVQEFPPANGGDQS